jgi:hypothetical protein
MPGYHEILIVVAVVAAVIFIPRVMHPRQPIQPQIRSRKKPSGIRRAAIALSVVYPLVLAAILQPWDNDLVTFLYVGLGPVILGWLLYWVYRGFAHRRY